MPMTRRFFAALMAAIFALIIPRALAETPADYDMNAPQALLPGHLYAQSALLVDADTGETLFSKNARVRMYPASTTKIMTLLLGLEGGPALDAQITIPQEAADIAEGSSVVPVLPGDAMSYGDLLYGFMLSSGNDGANAVAVLTDGSIDAFVARMNARAAELGMEGTHYANAHGYHDAEHYTTAQDLAILAREAMKNADFRKIVAAPTWTITIQRGGETLTSEIISRNSLLQSELKYYYPDCTGIKTGHHSKAGWCFVGSAERNGMSVICVVLNCAQENDKWYDAARLFEYGFTRYGDVALDALLQAVFQRFSSVQIENAALDDPQGGLLSLTLGTIEGGEQTIAVVQDSEGSMQYAQERVAQGVSIEWRRALEAPVAEGEDMGLLTCALPDGTVATARLTAGRSVAARQEAEAQTATSPAEAGNSSGGEGVEASGPPQADHPGAPGNRGAIIAIVVLAAMLAVCLFALSRLRAARRRRRRRRRRR